MGKTRSRDIRAAKLCKRRMQDAAMQTASGGDDDDDFDIIDTFAQHLLGEKSGWQRNFSN